MAFLPFCQQFADTFGRYHRCHKFQTTQTKTGRLSWTDFLQIGCLWLQYKQCDVNEVRARLAVYPSFQSLCQAKLIAFWFYRHIKSTEIYYWSSHPTSKKTNKNIPKMNYFNRKNVHCCLFATILFISIFPWMLIARFIASLSCAWWNC